MLRELAQIYGRFCQKILALVSIFCIPPENSGIWSKLVSTTLLIGIVWMIYLFSIESRAVLEVSMVPLIVMSIIALWGFLIPHCWRGRKWASPAAALTGAVMVILSLAVLIIPHLMQGRATLVELVDPLIMTVIGLMLTFLGSLAYTRIPEIARPTRTHEVARPSRIPEIARSIGKAIYTIKKEVTGIEGKTEEEYEAAIKEAAKRLGIETEGKSVSELAEEMARRRGRGKEAS
ncbi:MAG: hypothetical protein ACE5OY_00035 [Candidatus Bathyarchaeia archaeon]